MLKIIPNLFSLSNLLLGCFAIIYSFNFGLSEAGICILIAAILDFFDGFIARLLKTESPLGKELDSLSDMVTFGVAPSIIIYQMINISNSQYSIPVFEKNLYYNVFSLMVFVFALMSALRLSKFNIDLKQKNCFVGLATPAAAIFIASLPLILEYDMGLNPYFPYAKNFISSLNKYMLDNFESTAYILLLNSKFLLFLALILSLLMIIPLKMFSLKFSSFDFNNNKIRYSFIFFTIIVCSFFTIYRESFFISIPFVIIIYVLLSIFDNLADLFLSKK